MPIIFASNDPTDFGDAMELHTDVSYYDPNFVSNGMRRLAVTSGGTAPFGFTLENNPTGVVWVHFRMATPATNSNADGYLARFSDPSGAEVARIEFLNNEIAAEAVGDTEVTGGYVGFSPSLNTYDLKIEVGANIVVELYVGGSLMSSATSANTGGKLPPKFFQFDMNDVSQTNNGYYYFSEWIIAEDETTVGLRLSEMLPNADGNYTDGIGSASLLADRNSATGIGLDTAGQKRSYTFAAYAGPASPLIHSVVARSFVRIGGGAIKNARQFLRIGGTDYNGADESPHNYAGNITEAWALNPSTGAAWTESELGTLEAGIEARP